MTVSAREVEEYLQAHRHWAERYFIEHASLHWVNKWLLRHGLHTVTEPHNHRDSSQNKSHTFSKLFSDMKSTDSGTPKSKTLMELRGKVKQSVCRRISYNSPDRKMSDRKAFRHQTIDIAKHDSISCNDKDVFLHKRTESRKHLRSDFAKSKSKSIFRTHEPSIDSEHANLLAERRSSLKSMRQCNSLPTTSGTMLSILIQSNVSLPRYESKDEFYKRELRQVSEKDFFLEIVKDISHDLDLNSLTKMILINISILLDAEKCNLYFVDGRKENRRLVSKEFHSRVDGAWIADTHSENAECIPWGEGLIGHVAKSGEALNLSNVSKDSKYYYDAERSAGVPVESLLCMAIYNSDNDVIGVVQTTNKRDCDAFSTDDEKLLEMYLAFCGLAISNAQAIEAYSKEYDRNKALLEVVHDLFEEQTSVEKLVTKLMRRAQALLKCERCVVMLRDHADTSAKDEFTRVFDMQTKDRNGTPNSIKSYNAGDLKHFNFENLTLETTKNGQNGYHKPNIICKPIRDNECKSLGYAQLINKENGDVFDEHDNQFFEAFCIFCGLGINNCQLYDEVSRAAARQAVALEVISYHATVPLEDVYRIKEQKVPESGTLRLAEVDFNDFSLHSDDMVLAAMRIFIDSGLVQAFKIDYEKLVRWLLTVRKNYRSVAYHNWRHAFNVCQVMFVWLYTCGLKAVVSEQECLALLVACLCHDLDHRGTNNAFQHKCSTPLAQLYGTQATLEQHHFNHAVIILNSEGHNIFGNLSRTEYANVMKLLKHAILATDISKHIQVRDKFIPLVESGLYNWSDREQRDLLTSVLMTSCDVATITKPWHIQRKAADLVVTEFLNQGDKEKSLLKLQPAALMDRDKQDELPRLQIQWIDGICAPLYKSLAQMDAVFKPMLERVRENRDQWETLDRRRLEALTDESAQLYILETDV